ncbi:hypothetical protein KQ876_03560 [Mycoplasma sp. CSL7491-lung]|uniref:hypothetical protein n=1 Tax=Mycoplasma sp. CSL7491-lung TaxID=549718 RepID=UPI001C0F662A|nr:hypothetical protein [Mycoplasma sp. CSL7491-lung]MBU4693261.1 hypothetical protein [Mycoplasma sp. CSL7491-lung]
MKTKNQIEIRLNKRKLTLSGWLKENDFDSYKTPLKFQKFLFFYELFSKMDGDTSDFKKLKGYKNGPVFSNVWGYYTHNKEEFNIKITESLKENYSLVNLERAKKANFLIATLTQEELSNLTHQMNLWLVKKDLIMSGEKQVDLDEKDLNDDDFKLIKKLSSIASIETINNSTIYEIGEKYFVFSNKDSKVIKPEHLDILTSVSKDPELYNPVYVEIDEDGDLVID